MPYVTPTTRTTGLLVTAAIWNQDVVENVLTIRNGTAGFSGAIRPTTSDGAAIGTTALPWSDLFLASGAVIDFANGDVTMTHGSNTLTFGGASTGYRFNGGPVSVGAAAASDTLLTLVSAATNQQYIDVLRLETSDTGDRHPAIQFVGNRSGALKYAKIALDGGTTAGTGDLAYLVEDQHIWYTGSGTSGSGATVRMRLTSGGELGIGVSPLSTVHAERAGVDNIIAAIGQSGYEGILYLSGAGSGKDAAIIVGNNRDLLFKSTATATPTATATTRMVLTGGGNLRPGANDGGSLGVSGTAWADVFLASGGVINFAAGDVTLTHSTDALAFAGATSGYSFSDGDVNVNARLKANTTMSVGNATPSTSGAGITFPATQSASTNANTLDDYKEGGWTPVIEGTTTAGTAGYASNRYGSYIKIGRLITVTCQVSWTGHTGTGDMIVTGLPFSSRNIVNYRAIGSVVVSNVALTADYVAAIDIGQNESTIHLLQLPTGGGAAAAVPMDAGGSIDLTLTYETEN